jgi:hypothetical protein
MDLSFTKFVDGLFDEKRSTVKKITGTRGTKLPAPFFLSPFLNFSLQVYFQ